MNRTKCRKLILLYKKNKCLWDPNDINYTKRRVRNDVWRQISREMNTPVEELKKKMRSLGGGYRREKYREKQSRVDGAGAQDTYKSKWFAYDDFAFMAAKTDPSTTRDTLQNHHKPEQRSEQSNEDSNQSDELYQSEYQQNYNSEIENEDQETPIKETHNDLLAGTPSKRQRFNEPDEKVLNSTDQNLEHEFDLFCRSLAVQLKKMPLERALICQEKLQSVMVQERLSHIQSTSRVDSPPQDPIKEECVYSD